MVVVVFEYGLLLVVVEKNMMRVAAVASESAAVYVSFWFCSGFLVTSAVVPSDIWTSERV